MYKATGNGKIYERVKYDMMMYNRVKYAYKEHTGYMHLYTAHSRL